MQVIDLNYTKLGKVPAEYTIYAYNKYCEHKIGHNKWQCVSSGKDASKALEEAEVLFNSSKFQKIEIKKKFFDKKMDRYAVSTFKVLSSKPKKPSIFITMGILIFTVLFGGLFILELL